MSDPNPTPNPEPNPNPTPAPAPEPTAEPKKDQDPAPVELKPLTEEEIASMSTEEITAHAEKLEAQNKEGKKQTPEQIRENQTKRLQNAQEKAFGQTTPQPEPTEPQKKEIAQADLVTLGRSEFDIGSPEQILLQERVEQGIISSYAEGFEHVGVKAELEKIKSDRDADTVINENDAPEKQLQTTKEAVAAARASGEVPEDPRVRQAMVEENLGNMSALK